VRVRIRVSKKTDYWNLLQIVKQTTNAVSFVLDAVEALHVTCLQGFLGFDNPSKLMTQTATYVILNYKLLVIKF
jgi:hypothetical protein